MKFTYFFFCSAGAPLGFCKETKPGVFERKWSKADISINCNDFTADIKMTG